MLLCNMFCQTESRILLFTSDGTFMNFRLKIEKKRFLKAQKNLFLYLNS